MASRKDMRRQDLIVPYMDPPNEKSDPDMAGTMAMPMAAIFTRNKTIGWTAVAFAVQAWMGETAESKKTSSTPALFSVGMSLMSLCVVYMPLFLPPPGGASTGTGTEAPSAVPLA